LIMVIITLHFWTFYGNSQIITFIVSNFEGYKFLPIVIGRREIRL